MKTLIIPENIALRVFNEDTKEDQEVSYSFFLFMAINILRNVVFGASIDTLRLVAKLGEQLKLLNPGDEWSLEDPIYEQIKKLVCYPTVPYNVQQGLKLLPFMEAFEGKACDTNE